MAYVGDCRPTLAQDITGIEDIEVMQGLESGSSLGPKLLQGTEEPDGPGNPATPMA